MKGWNFFELLSVILTFFFFILYMNDIQNKITFHFFKWTFFRYRIHTSPQLKT